MEGEEYRSLQSFLYRLAPNSTCIFKKLSKRMCFSVNSVNIDINLGLQLGLN